MKLDLRRFRADPSVVRRCAVVAIFGASAGLVREAAREAIRAECLGERDDLRVTALDSSEPGRVSEAMRSLPLGGGRGVVWVDEASDKLAPVIEAALADARSALLVLGYGERFGAGRLGGSIEGSPRGCLVDATISRTDARERFAAVLRALSVEADENAALALIAWAQASGQTVEAVAMAAGLLVGPGGVVDMPATQRLSAAPEASGVVRAVTAGLRGGGAADLDRAVHAALEDGVGGVGILRQALYAVHASRGRGPSGIEAQAESLWDAERAVKRTGMPQDLVAAAAVCALSNRSRA